MTHACRSTDSRGPTALAFAFALAFWACPPASLAGDTIRVAPPPGANGFGAKVCGIADVNGDGFGDILATAVYAVQPGGSLGAVYVLSGATGDVIRVHGAQAASTEYYGSALLALPDLDGDGVGDYLVGDPYRDVSGNGRSHVDAGGFDVFSGASGTLLVGREAPLLHDDGGFGWAAAVIPDYQGPGQDALLVGEPLDADVAPGRVHIYSLATWDLLATHIDPAAPLATGFGMAVAGYPDANGDGRGDFAVGAPLSRFLGLQSVGRLHIYANGTLIDSLDPLHIAEGVFFASSLAGVADMTGDGRGDVVVGSPDESPGGVVRAGCVYVVSGATATVASLVTEQPPRAEAIFGIAVTSVPDRDGDGRPEWVAGASGRDDLPDPPSGRVLVGAWPSVIGAPAEAKDYRFGRSVASVPDVNGDGHADVVVGNEWEWVSGDAGAVYIVRALRNDECTSLADGVGEVFQGATPITTIGASPTPNLEINPSQCMPVDVHDVWFRHAAQCTGTLVIETCGATGFDSMLAVYEGCTSTPETCSLGAELACNDDACATGSRVELPVTAGSCYVIRVATYPGTPAGTATLSITCTSNCPYDLNADGHVDAADLAILLGVWGTDKPEADFDQSGLIDAADLAQLLGAWSSCGA